VTLVLLMAFACTPKPVPPVAPPVEPVAPLEVTPVPAATVETAVDGSPAPAPQNTGHGSVEGPHVGAAEAPTGTDASGAPGLADAVAMLTTGDKGRAQAALDLLKPLSAQYPDVVEIPYNVGVAHHILGEETEARRAWLRATEVDPSFAKSWLNLGALSAQRGQMEAALGSFQAGIRQAPQSVELRIAAIDAQRALRRYPEAVAEAKAALLVDSRAIGIYNSLAAVYLATDQLDLARFMSLKALEVVQGAERSAELQANFGQIYLRTGYPGDALEAFRKSLELNPNQAVALEFLSGHYLDNRNYDDALPLLERQARLFPTQAGPRLSLGIAYRGQGRFEDAIKAYDEALKLDPANPEPHRNLAVVYGDYLKSWDTAIAEIEAYRKAGGGPAAELDAWVTALGKDKEKALRQQRRDEAARREREAAEAPAPAPAPVVPPAPEESPVPDVAPAPEATPDVAPAPAPEAPPEPAGESPAPSEGSPETPWGGQ
jgi:tetratricopeptide (TPR) repeat protein